VAYYPCSWLSLRAFARPALYLYTRDTATVHNRYDFNFQTGATLTWEPASFFQVGGGLVWTFNDSNIAAADYREALPGVSLYCRVAF
jgi:hypothetical protein